MIRNKRDDAWVFHNELIHIFLLCRNFPLAKKNGNRVAFGDILRIERHCFKVAFDPKESKIAYRLICGADVVMKPRSVNGTDTIVIDDAVSKDNSADGGVAERNCENDVPMDGDESLLADEELDAVLAEANVSRAASESN